MNNTATEQRLNSCKTSAFPLEKEKKNLFPVLNHKETLTICLLDDDPSVLKATSRLLASEGWKVKSFLCPHEFLDFARESRPRLVVIDILMPEMNGLEVQRRLGTISPETRVIVLTSKDDHHVRTTAIAAGAVHFFLKPVADEEFLAGIEQAAAQG